MCTTLLRTRPAHPHEGSLNLHLVTENPAEDLLSVITPDQNCTIVVDVRIGNWSVHWITWSLMLRFASFTVSLNSIRDAHFPPLMAKRFATLEFDEPAQAEF